MNNKSYIGISLIILIFGIIFIPKIIDRISNDEVVKNDRLNIGEGFKKSDKLNETQDLSLKKRSVSPF